RVSQNWTKSSGGALLHLGIGLGLRMCSVGGRLCSRRASVGGVNSEMPPLRDFGSIGCPCSGSRTLPGGQFDWGGRLLKGNGGAQRYPQAGWKSALECKGIRVLDCEAYKPSRDESRA